MIPFGAFKHSYISDFVPDLTNPLSERDGGSREFSCHKTDMMCSSGFCLTCKDMDIWVINTVLFFRASYLSDCEFLLSGRLLNFVDGVGIWNINFNKPLLN